MSEDSRTDDLLARLTADLRPVRRVAHPAMAVLAWLTIAALVIGVVVALSGFRDDIAHRLARCNHGQGLIFTVRQGIVQRRFAILVETVGQFLGQRGADVFQARRHLANCRHQFARGALLGQVTGRTRLQRADRILVFAVHRQHQHRQVRACRERVILYGPSDRCASVCDVPLVCAGSGTDK